MMNGEELKTLRAADRRLKKALDMLYEIDDPGENINQVIIKLLEVKERINNLAEEQK